MFGIFKRETRSRSLDGEIVSLQDIEALTKRLGHARAGEIIREKAISGNKVCQSFMSGICIYMLDNIKLPPGERAATKRDAEQFTRLAAESGDKEAQFNLSLMIFRKMDASSEYIYEEDVGHIREAKRWAEKSAAQGYQPASEILRNLEAFREFF